MQDVNRTKLVLVEQKKGGVRDVDNIVEEQQETQLFQDACQIVEQAQETAYRQVNETLIKRNWLCITLSLFTTTTQTYSTQ